MSLVIYIGYLMRYRKRRVFIQCTTNTPTHSLSIKCISIKLKVLFLTEPRTPRDKNDFPGLKLSSQEKCLRQEWLSTFSFWSTDTFFPSPLIPRQLTACLKFPFKVVSSLKACKLYSSSYRCLKPSCLNDISDGGNEKGPNETVDRNSAPATSL